MEPRPPSDVPFSPAAAGDPLLGEAWEWSHLLELPIDDLVLSPSPPTQPAPVELAAGRVRKRDTRLLCENFLAGRVPCACPELDEAEEEEEAAASGMTEKKRVRRVGVGVGPLARCQVPGCEADISELKGYHRRHRVCLACANAVSVALEGEAKRYCQQCGKFHVLADFDEGKRSCRRKLERHNKRRRRRPADENNVTEKASELQGAVHLDIVHEEKKNECLDGTSFETSSLCLDEKTTDAEVLLDSEGHGSPFCSSPIVRNGYSNNVGSCAVSNDTLMEERVDNPKSMISSSFYGNTTKYSTSCPTGRISFKLYDWNPAEFPRHLRLQVLHWLASMPVELEGYIRPGCTILTFFIAMPQMMWSQLSNDAAFYLHQFFKDPENLFFGRGKIHIHLNNMLYQLQRDGTSLVNMKMEVQVPKLHYVHPLFFEAGEPVEFIVCGSNLLQPKLRFLVSFAGKYLAGGTFHLLSCGNVEGGPDGDCEHQIYRISFPRSEPKVYGPAFVEVENESGLSNFISVLFANKHVCSELRSQHLNYLDLTIPQIRDPGAISSYCEAHCSVHSKMCELLLDVAWLSTDPQLQGNPIIFSPINIHRIENLLNYLAQSNYVNVLRSVMHTVKSRLDSLKLQVKIKTPDGVCRADAKKLEACMFKMESILRKKLESDTINNLNSDNPTHIVFQNINKSHLLDSALYVPDHVPTEVEIWKQNNPLLFEHKDDNHPLLPNNVPTQNRSDYMPTKWAVVSMDLSRKVLLFTGVLICCGLCAVLLHPRMAGRLMVSARKCVSGSP